MRSKTLTRYQLGIHLNRTLEPSKQLTLRDRIQKNSRLHWLAWMLGWA